MVSGWTKTKQEQMVAHGYFPGGVVPFGYDKQIVSDSNFTSRNGKEPPKRLTPDTQNAPFLRRAFEVFVETRSYPRVAEYLRSVTSRKWTVQAVRHILHNEVYRGVLRHGPNVNYTAHEPIISEALWDAVQDADARRPPRSTKRNMKDTFPYYLRGLVFCPHCGCRMTPTWHQGMNSPARYYECLSAMKKITTDCPSRRVNAQALHAAVLQEIGRASQHPTRLQGYIREAIQRLPDTSAVKSQLVSVGKRVRDVERRIALITRAIEEGAALRSFLQRLEELEQERVSLEAERLKLEAQSAAHSQRRPDAKRAAELLGQFLELWEYMTDEEREQAMQLLVEKVEIRSKEEGTCRIRISDRSPSHKWNLQQTIEPFFRGLPQIGRTSISRSRSLAAQTMQMPGSDPIPRILPLLV
jgi:hypothetical protein